MLPDSTNRHFAPNASSARNIGQPPAPRGVITNKNHKLRDFRLCSKMSALSGFLMFPIGGAVSAPARFNPPTEYDLREFIDLSLNLLCIAGTDARWRTLTDLPVLIVDDNATNRRILEEVFTNWHMRPIAVESGAAALGTLEKSLRADQPFAVVLLDGHMPDMDGFSAAERISHDRRYADIKLVMLTSAVSPRMSGAVASWASQRISPSRSSNPSSLMRLSVPSVSQW
jgi:CheY-like chemotaxis protein